VNACQKAFTIIELLVVISIISVLLALLVPAVLRARSAARRTDFLHRMRQVGQALNTFAISKGRYPGYVDRILSYRSDVDPRFMEDRLTHYGGLGRPETWVVKILPELEQGSLQEAIIDVRRVPHKRQIISPEVKPGTDFFPFLPVLACPSDTSFERNYPCLSFVVNCGVADPAPPNPEWNFVSDSRANGIFHNMGFNEQVRPQMKGLRMGTDYIARHDGTANTLILSENLDAGSWAFGGEVRTGFCWYTREGKQVFGMNVHGGEYPLRKDRIHKVSWDVYGQYDFDYRYSRPSSHHPGGVNVVFSDGHGQFLREDIDYWVYVQLMTPDGKNAVIDAHNKVPAPPEYRQLLL
jgi:prepilin-type N-terminal cleavage/methylation domain-containing protein/prepilin-type processing-associated H-X9-DG protein